MKDQNKNEDFCSIENLPKNYSVEEIRQVAKELAAQDLIMFDEDKIYFLD